ncbi:MAG: hypothetical protein IJ619_05525 [Eubacterium sp.]|nr:hypothetical protein [Eubacterium sp.]
MKEVLEDEELLQEEKTSVQYGDYYVPNMSDGDEKERIERAKAIYAGLNTMEEKLRFLVDYGTYIRSTRDTENFSQLEENASQELEDSFLETYIVNGSSNQIRQVSEALGKLSSEVKLDILKDEKDVIKTLDEGDENGIKKAHWVARNNEKNNSFHSSVSEVMSNVGRELMSNDKAIDTVFKGLNISADDTMTDYVIKLGNDTPQMVQASLEEKGAKDHANMTVYEFYSMKYLEKNPGQAKPTKESVLNYIKEGAVSEKHRAWRYHADQKNIQNKMLSDEDKKLYEYSSRHFNEAAPQGGISDWIDSTGRKMADDLEKNAKKEIADKFRDKYIIPYVAKKDGFELVDDPVRFNGKFTKNEINDNIIGTFMPLANLFGDRANAVREKTVELTEGLQQIVTAGNKAPINDIDIVDFGSKLRKFTDFIKAEKNQLPEGSYRRKTIDMYLKHVDMFTNGDYKLLESVSGDRTIYDFNKGTFNNFPQPRMVSKRDEQGRPVEIVNDPEKYEEFMAKHKFYEQYAEKQKYISEVQIPYIKAKQAGKADLKAEKDYKKATYDHLLKEKEYFNQINAVQYNDVKDFEPFAKRKDALAMDWAGNRFGKLTEKKNNREISALEHGWAPEDLPMIHSIDGFMNTIKSAKDQNQINERKYAQFKRMYDTFVSSYIDEKIDRRRLIAGVRPLYQEYKRLKPNDDKHYAENYDKQRDKEVSITQVNPDDALRNETIHILTEAYADLSVDHSISLKKHRDSDEMEALKEKTLEALRAISNNRDKKLLDIVVRTDEPDKLGGEPKRITVEDVLNEVKQKAVDYRDAKIEEYKEEYTAKVEAEKNKEADKIWQEAINKYVTPAEQRRIKEEFDEEHPIDPENISASGLKRRKTDIRRAMLDSVMDKKAREKVERDISFAVYRSDNAKNSELQEKLKRWRPSSKMGKTRYEASEEMVKKLDNVLSNLAVMSTIKREVQESIQDIKEAGRNVVSSKELEYHAKYPYEKGVAQILNYYGTNPAFIPEHCDSKDKRKMYNKKEFLEGVKPVDIKGISSDDFALVAFSVAMDGNNITPEEFKKHNNYHDNYISHKDMTQCNRTMYTFDMAMLDPRACMVTNFFGYTVIPFKEKAKEAIEAYKNGDNTKISDIMATGLKQINSDASHNMSMSYPNVGDFSYMVGMLSKTMEFVKKDKALYSAVKSKIGIDGMNSIKDTLRLKKYMDEAYDAKQKLEQAARDHKPLSEEEKKRCVNSIVRETLITKLHNKIRVEQIDDSPIHAQALAEMQQNYANMATNGLTTDEMQNKLDVVDYNLRKPIPQITTRLRTPEGRQRLDDTVSKYASKIKTNLSEKDLLKSLNKLENAIDEKFTKERNAELKRRADAQKQAEANKKKEASKKVVNKL